MAAIFLTERRITLALNDSAWRAGNGDGHLCLLLVWHPPFWSSAAAAVRLSWYPGGRAQNHDRFYLAQQVLQPRHLLHRLRSLEIGVNAEDAAGAQGSQQGENTEVDETIIYERVVLRPQLCQIEH